MQAPTCNNGRKDGPRVGWVLDVLQIRPRRHAVAAACQHAKPGWGRHHKDGTTCSAGVDADQGRHQSTLVPVRPCHCMAGSHCPHASRPFLPSVAVLYYGVCGYVRILYPSGQCLECLLPCSVQTSY